MKLSICLVAILAIFPYEIVGNINFGIGGLWEMFKGYMESSRVRKKTQLSNLQPIINGVENGEISRGHTFLYLKRFKKEADGLLKLRDEILENKNVMENSPELKAFEESFDESNKYYQTHLDNLTEETLNMDNVVAYLKSLMKVRGDFESFASTLKLDYIIGSLKHSR